MLDGYDDEAADAYAREHDLDDDVYDDEADDPEGGD